MIFTIAKRNSDGLYNYIIVDEEISALSQISAMGTFWKVYGGDIDKLISLGDMTTLGTSLGNCECIGNHHEPVRFEFLLDGIVLVHEDIWKIKIKDKLIPIDFICDNNKTLNHR